MVSRDRLALVVAGGLSLYLYGTFLWNYLPGRGRQGLLGVAPNFLLAAIVGGLVAAGTDHRITDYGQFLRVAWYPAWGLLVCVPLFGVLALRGYSIGQWVTYPLVIGSVLGIVQELRRW